MCVYHTSLALNRSADRERSVARRQLSFQLNGARPFREISIPQSAIMALMLSLLGGTVLPATQTNPLSADLKNDYKTVAIT